ncbi:MAG: AAA family ATPase [Saprospiraceae bacterium]|nr:AAA family ATPase [Saprospiraceae bacterium]
MKLSLPYIKDIKISNYKQFDEIHLSNLGRINLITGDNNVGKTSLLETFYLNDSLLLNTNFIHKSLCHRGVHCHLDKWFKPGLEVNNRKDDIATIRDYFNDYILNQKESPVKVIQSFNNGTKLSIEICTKGFSQLSEVEKVNIYQSDFVGLNTVPYYILQYNNDVLKDVNNLYLDDFERNRNKFLQYFPLISASDSYDDDLTEYYYSALNYSERFTNLNLSSRNWIFKLLQNLEPGFERMEVGVFESKTMLSVKLKNKEELIPVTWMGQGFQRYLRMILELVSSTDPEKEIRFMIDEVENGIHFTRLNEMWRSLFSVVKSTKLQLFLTTHSLECIKAFVEVGLEDDNLDFNPTRLK